MKVLIPENKEIKSKIKLDHKDKRILSILTQNCRIGVSSIASMIGLERHVVDYKIKSFFTHQLFTGSTTVINFRKLGYFTYHIFLELKSPEDEIKIINKGLEKPSVNTIISYSGRYALEISIIASNPKEFIEEYEDLIRDTNIISDAMLIIIDTIKGEVLPKFLDFREPIRMKRKDSSFETEFHKIAKEESKLDNKDLMILKELSKNAMLPLKDISEKVKMSPDAVSYRIKNMIHSGIIVQFRPIINFSAFNLSIHCLLLRAIFPAKEYEKEFKEFVKKSNDILWCAKSIGNFNYILYLASLNMEELHSIIGKIKNEFSKYIIKYEVLYAYKGYKYSYFSENIRLIN